MIHLSEFIFRKLKNITGKKTFFKRGRVTNTLRIPIKRKISLIYQIFFKKMQNANICVYASLKVFSRIKRTLRETYYGIIMKIGECF